jgi:hypothetical protein
MTLVAVTVTPAPGQITGRVEGIVVDGLTGEPLIGGLVIVEATNLGNVTRNDGSFFINDVPVGRHRIVSEYLGYRSIGDVRRILAGETVSVEFRMTADVIQSDAIAVVIEREPLRPPPPERVYTRTPPPGAGLRTAGFTCSARAVLHGSYIQDGRWQLQSSVRNLACQEVVPAPAPEPQPEEMETLEGVIHVSSLRSQAGQK